LPKGRFLKSGLLGGGLLRDRVGKFVFLIFFLVVKCFVPFCLPKKELKKGTPQPWPSALLTFRCKRGIAETSLRHAAILFPFSGSLLAQG
jgi:hypothetical protein